jgi:hypothetical protein
MVIDSASAQRALSAGAHYKVGFRPKITVIHSLKSSSQYSVNVEGSTTSFKDSPQVVTTVRDV